MHLRLCLLCLALVSNGIAASTTERTTAPARPNIILITLDTTRADRMGFLGSTPSHAAILTGTYPQFNHVSDLGMPLGKDLPYIPELLRRSGYRTAAFVGSMILDPKGLAASGFERGFDVYDAGFHKRAPGEDRYHSVERRAGDVVDHALGWLKKRPEGPFFIWVHVYDAHDPYDPPDEIAYTDSAMGKLLAELHTRGLYENTIIAVMADHGEAFGEHGELRHGMFLYDETIHVPLLVKFPREHFGGTKVDGRVRLVDVAPTVLQAARVPVPQVMQGQALQELVKPGKKSDATATPEIGFGNRKPITLNALLAGVPYRLGAMGSICMSRLPSANSTTNHLTRSRSIIWLPTAKLWPTLWPPD